jgi:sortase A
MSWGDRARWVISGLGQLMITFGVVLLLFCVYELRFTNVYTGQQQDKLGKELETAWAAPTPKARTAVLPAYQPGQGIARIFLPTVGDGQVHVVVEGVSRSDLKKGPGHYPGTDVPGALGNVVISGHRTTYGAPFNRLDELELGDPIVLETQTTFFTYRVIKSFVVRPDALGETEAVPGRPGVAPTERLLTLTTCNPKYSARTRLIVRAVLEAALAKAPGVVPPALASMAKEV